MPRRSVLAPLASLTVASAVLLVVACTGGPGSLGEFGDDGLEGQQQASSSSGQASSSTSSSSSSSGVASSSGSTSSSGVTIDAGQRFSCGTKGLTCSGSQYCVVPCCTQAKCYALDAGVTTCPAGYTYGICATAGTYGCNPNPCTPPNPYCTTSLASLPAGCSQNGGDSRKVDCVCQ